MAPVNRTPAAVYVRISQDREGAGLGVERQEGDCRALAERLGWDVVEVFSDNDLSAYSAKRRPAYERLLDALESGRVRGVLTWHTDRLHKNPMELERYIDICGPRAISTHTVKAGHIDLTTPSGRMVARIYGATARAESERIGERVAAARAQGRAAGKFHGGPRPFGFEPDGVTLRPSEAAEIVRATESLLSGGSVRGVVLDLNQRGVLTSSGKAWHSRTLRDMVIRHRNAGLIAHGGEVVGPAAWPAVVTEAQRARVAQLLSDPARRTSPGNVVRYLGSFLFHCGVCRSQRIVAHAAGGTKPGRSPRRVAYRCSSREVFGAKNHLARDQQHVDDLVTETVLARLEREDARDLVVVEEPGVDLAALSDEVGALRARRKWMISAAGDGTITESELREELRKMTTRTAEIEGQLAAAPSASPVAALATAEDVRAAWDELDLGRRRAVIDALAIVTLVPTPQRGPKFDPDSVLVEWRF